MVVRRKDYAKESRLLIQTCMNGEIRHCIIIGSSRGLGAALVEEFLNKTTHQIIGIARTKLEEIKNHKTWIASGRYCHVEIDISSYKSRETLRYISEKLPYGPVCVIFNSAHIEKDINKDQTINYSAFDAVNRVGINGFGNILFAFEPHFLKYGGILVGISSFWGTVSPLFLPWIAYPASKAYLNMALRCLRVAWRNHVKTVIVNIGRIEEPEKSNLPRWVIPPYSLAAGKIVSSLLSEKIPNVIDYPLWHAVVYRYILRFVPDIVYSWIFKLYFKLESLRKKR